MIISAGDSRAVGFVELSGREAPLSDHDGLAGLWDEGEGRGEGADELGEAAFAI